jgi:CRP-like cAMP-binding protein
VNEMTELCKEFKYGFRRKGEKICSCGDKDDKLYLLLRGKVAFSVVRQDV